MPNNEGQAHHACAPCRHQRKKCTPEECMLGPFFPADHMDRFLPVLHVFGVKNVQNMLKNIKSHDDRQKAVDFMVWEAQCWQLDPVHGCSAQLMKLQEEMNLLRQDNNRLQNENAFLRSQSSHCQCSGLYSWTNTNNSISPGTDLGNNMVYNGGGYANISYDTNPRSLQRFEALDPPLQNGLPVYPQPLQAIREPDPSAPLQNDLALYPQPLQAIREPEQSAPLQNALALYPQPLQAIREPDQSETSLPLLPHQQIKP